MGKLILFEAPEPDSIIEILWDIALAVFIIRLALLYAALTYGSALAVLALLPQRLPPTFSFLQPPPVLVLTACSALWARYAIVRHEMPRVVAFRLVVGFTAGVVVVLAETLLAGLVDLVLYESGWTGTMAEGLRMGWGEWMGTLAAFMLMPVVQMMVFEHGRRKEGEVKVGKVGDGKEKRRVGDVM